jgi:undecaprenol kinase
MKNKLFHHRLGFALQGIGSGLRRESSLRQQAAAAVLVLALLVWRRPAAVWWALLFINCGTVLAAELLNTALEEALDLLNPQLHPAVKRAKDCAAGAVLVLSLTALATFIAFLAATFRTGP